MRKAVTTLPVRPGKILRFTDLVAWQKAHELVLSIYRESMVFPADERFGLTKQIRRSAMSTTANIAEGFGRQGRPDKIQFYVMARGSITELQDHLLTARNLGYITEIAYSELAGIAIVVHKLINGLIRSIRGV